jgi:hypothetical protein
VLCRIDGKVAILLSQWTDFQYINPKTPAVESNLVFVDLLVIIFLIGIKRRGCLKRAASFIFFWPGFHPPQASFDFFIFFNECCLKAL